MKTITITLRTLQTGDAAAAMKLSAAEGWNQTANDWNFLIADPRNICIAAVCEEDIIATTTAIHYSNRLAWIGMVLVNKEYRGRGISKLLLEHVFKKIESFPSVKLDATAQGQQVYKKFGFKNEYRIARMVNTAPQKITIPGGVLPEPIRLEHIPEIIALDEIVFGVNRTPLIEMLIRTHPHKAWVLLQNNQVTGFSLGRDGSKYHHIGPVIAQTQSDANLLMLHALNQLTGKPVVADVLCDKEELMHSLTAIGFSTQRYFTRMYKAENHFPGTSSMLYAICGPEFG
ncbi:GNAT family N-acetyltransferase [Agriterribacter sp.]|uniref:GNAT family N-acetyltransferase n=1 Tax=Agriterribacter sp. TaxID=2821509 RepID=UPI002C515C0F|nr:GNAT family N-acetyltransferase [Agriterribacter sp.]HTN08338.1 GNAT family N-acetyltransferase [Agriterribacter sp.]